MRCAFPRCYREAETRCPKCKRVYCPRHCGDRVFASGERVPECDLCDPIVAAELSKGRSPLATVLDYAAVAVFLILVALGIAIDITARGSGLIALWVFVGAFIAFVVHLQR
jgi:hypothetical protein